MSQSAKSDPDCEYIKEWLPFLKDVHNWPTKYSKYTIDYPKPMVNYPEEYKKSKELFKKHV
jgi:deoxyribodipyrimidine photolyase